LVSAIPLEGEFTNLGPDNTGDLNVMITDEMSTVVHSEVLTGVTINAFSDSTFAFTPADASEADSGRYDVTMYASNFNDGFTSNDTMMLSHVLGDQIAFDNGVQSTSGTFSATARSWFGVRYTLSDPDTLKNISILVSASALATDSFAVEIWDVVNDSPNVALTTIYEGAYSELGTLPAMVKFEIPGGYLLPAGDFAVVFDMKNTNSYPCGVDYTAMGAQNIPNTFWGKLETTTWLPFETVGAGTWTPIMRAGFGKRPAGPTATLPFMETFDDTSLAIPMGWSRFEIDGGDEVPGADWVIDDGTGAGYPPYQGDGLAMNWYQAADPSGYIDEWLVTPQLLDYQSGMELSFYLKHVSGQWDDSLMVMVSTTGMAPGDFTEIAYLNSPVDWTQFAYDLSTYGVMPGDNFYIAFRYLHYDGGSAGANSNVITIDEMMVDYRTLAIPYFDDFDSYTAGVQLALQNPIDWTTWSGLPGSGEDAFVSDAHAYSGSNSVVVVQNNDLVKLLGQQTSGMWKISFQVYIPTGKAGYFNTLSGFTPNPFEWGMECYFDVGGGGRLLGGSATAVTFTYAVDTWQLVEVIVDLDNDMAQFWFDGAMIHEWQWTLGASGGGSALQLD
ncbi:MAG: choice-of-anchor J domain-containing protein, partial [Calditrichia bacterium]